MIRLTNHKQIETIITPIEKINEIPKSPDIYKTLNTAEQKVKFLCKKYPYAIKDYALLYLMYLKEEGTAEIHIDIKKFMKSLSPETIDRMRRKLIEEHTIKKSDEQHYNSKAQEKEFRRAFKK